MPIMTSGFGQLSTCGLMVPKLDSNSPWFSISISRNDGAPPPPLLAKKPCCCECALNAGRVIHGEVNVGSEDDAADEVDMLPAVDWVENPSDGDVLLISKSA